MSAITTPKIHQFVPLAFPRVVNIKSPLYGSPKALGECRQGLIAEGATTFQFPENHHPHRVDDILLVRMDDGRVLPNRQAPEAGPGRTTVFKREFFDYNPQTRIATFHQPVPKACEIHWVDMKGARMYNDQWVDIDPMGRMIQGSDYVDEHLIPPGATNLTGKFQGSFLCFPEIVSMPKHGIAKISDDTRGFQYRGTMRFIGVDSFEYLLYNALGQVSDTCCITINCS